MNKSARRVAIFLKYPAPGAVKTRLARVLGDSAAAQLYHRWIGQVLTALQPLRPDVRLQAWFAGAPQAAFAEWFGLVDDWRPQPAGDLGVRLAAAFDGNNASRTGNIARRKTIAIGTDCLDLDASLLTAGFHILDDYDVVLGPAPDGGYYLIGTAGTAHGLFDNIRWSTSHTRTDQVEQCQRQGLSVGMLPPRSDIDTWEDWREYQKRHSTTPDRADSG